MKQHKLCVCINGIARNLKKGKEFELNKKITNIAAPLKCVKMPKNVTTYIDGYMYLGVLTTYILSKFQLFYSSS